ncbi:MarR family winged helix-turn-helix transcriptional regulator [Lentzea guizhouensis]|uniref:MarR family winged helix-turn-helix transcriptional regulator n=1 Tax=Lentzea guizhouensis TaxID=1586287 RepID=UPI001F158D00|nr:MarR family winged helix-turn-helix transcriptional regulator [Lentzea guizhouensis]
MDVETHLAAVEQALIAMRRSQSRRALAELAVPAFEVLDVIEAAERSGSQATVSGVAAALHVDQPRASKLVTSAVDAGLVARVADKADGRRVLLVRTPRGRATSADLHRARQAACAAAMADWSDEERVVFAGLLTRFVAVFGAR